MRRSRVELGERVAQVRHHRLEIGDERHVRARARDVGQVDRRGDDRLLPERPANAHLALRAGEHRAAGEHASRPRCRRGSPARRRSPCSSAMSRVSRSQRDTLAGPGTSSVLRPRSARGRRGRHEDDLRAVERGDRPAEAVPGIFAHEDRGASPRRVERADVATALDEALLVEQPVRRQEHLAMDVTHERHRLRRARRTARCCTACCATPRRTRRTTSSVAAVRVAVDAMRGPRRAYPRSRRGRAPRPRGSSRSAPSRESTHLRTWLERIGLARTTRPSRARLRRVVALPRLELGECERDEGRHAIEAHWRAGSRQQVADRTTLGGGCGSLE